jgi:hypothetical protein
MLADAYNVTSGMIDAFVWVLVYGSIAAIIYGVVKGVKSARSTESLSSEKETSTRTVSQSKRKRITKKLSKLEPPRWPPLPGQEVPSGWYEDPSGRGSHRYFESGHTFSSARWTERIQGHLSGGEYDDVIPDDYEIDGVVHGFLSTLPKPLPQGVKRDAGFLPDPLELNESRYWDGSEWTTKVLKNGLEIDELFDSEQIEESSDLVTTKDTNENNLDMRSNYAKELPLTERDFVNDLDKIIDHYKNGLLSETEFKAAKERIFGNGSVNE